MSKPILCVDFDGVIHSYSSGWKGAAVIPDAPVPGALEAIVRLTDDFDVAIFSARSNSLGGRRAMKRWLKSQLKALAPDWETTPEWWRRRIAETAFADPWDDEVWWATNLVMGKIKWPWFKPSAVMTIDDRALTFNGDWSDQAYTAKGIRMFKPWNKRLDKIEMPSALISDPAFHALRKVP
jgi:hypothetical protein